VKEQILWLILGLACYYDFRIRQIPDWLTLPAIVAGLILCPHNWTGVLAGGGCMYLVGLLGNLLGKKECIGGGDLKLLAAIGAFVGWRLVLAVFFVAPLILIFLPIFKGRSKTMPYAPYLALATLVVLLFKEKMFLLLTS